MSRSFSHLVLSLFLLVSFPLAADEEGFLGLFGALGGNTSEIVWSAGGEVTRRDPVVGGFGWGLGVDGYMNEVRAGIQLYLLNPGLSYLAAGGEADILGMISRSRDEVRPYWGLGFGLGNLTTWVDGGVSGSTFAFDVRTSAGLLATELGLLWIQTGFIFANTSLGESGDYSQNEWFLLAGLSLGWPWKAVNRFLDS